MLPFRLYLNLFLLLSPLTLLASGSSHVPEVEDHNLHKEKVVAKVEEALAQPRDLDDVAAEQEEYAKGTGLLNLARLTDKSGKTDKAEFLYLEALQYKLTISQRKELLVELALMYEKIGQDAKMAMVYEKYLEMYPDDENKPQILLRLGRLYRDMASYNLAIARFYSILNLSLATNQKQLSIYRYISTKAQLEIADTFFIMQDYPKALKLFQRLQLVDMTEEEAARVQFKLAYTQFYLKNYEDVITIINKFLETYPKSPLAPESHFVLANAYKEMGRFDQAIQQVIKLLNKEKQAKADSEQAWLYWKQKTANQLANEFYEKNDYLSALKIYQAMATLNPTPDWQWPIIYQIGRCFENLNKHSRAVEAYELIVSEDQWKDQKYQKTDTLSAIQETAKWRLDHLNWLTKTKSKMDDIFYKKEEPKPTPAPASTKDSNEKLPQAA